MSYTRVAEDVFDASQPFVGEIQMFAANFAPVGWAFCDGSLLAIANYSVLFNLIGTTYGGDGVTTFGLPNLNGRTAIHQGTNFNGVTYVIGEMGGATSATFLDSNLPVHDHTLTGQVALLSKGDNPGNSATPASGTFPSIAPGKTYYSPTALGPGSLMGPLTVNMTVGTTGASIPVSTLQPYVSIYYIISLFGIYPSQ